MENCEPGEEGMPAKKVSSHGKGKSKGKGKKKSKKRVAKK